MTTLKEYILLCVEYNITQYDGDESITYTVDSNLLLPVELRSQFLEASDLWEFLATHETYYSDSEEIMPYIVTDVLYGTVDRTHNVSDSPNRLFHVRMRELKLAY